MRKYGARYGAMGGKYLSAAEIAKLMRADIKAEIAAGNLPGSARDYGVRVHNYSGGRSIRIEARHMEHLWIECDGRDCRDVWCKAKGLPEYAAHAQTHKVLSAEGKRILAILQSIHDAYNHDGSDVMTDYFDVNYYGEASIEGQYPWRA
jgi:hypothetical protein